ncbi:MAG: NUDIX domain-containing protein [bacterium]|nr:NUDIX domain-containing protein [Candidatus Kapabacteria bacterium]
MPDVRADIIQVHPFRIRNGVVEHLILLRSNDDELCPGAWQVVTGGIEPNETAPEAALRELAEETGLVPVRWFITGRVATFYFQPFDCVMMSPIVACEIPCDVDPGLSLEHSAFRWCTAADAMAALSFASQRDGVGIVEEHVASKPA